MLCPNCQQTCRDTAVLCIHCGATLGGASTSQVEKPTWDIASTSLHGVAEPSEPSEPVEPAEPAAANMESDPVAEAPSDDYRRVNYLSSAPVSQSVDAAEPTPSPSPPPSVEPTESSSRMSGVWVFILIVAVVAYRFGQEDSADPPPTETPAAVATEVEEAPRDAAPVEAAPAEEEPVATGAVPADDSATGTGSGLYLDVTNATSYVIGRIYVSPSSATSWGEDKLGTQVLPQGNTIRIPLGEYTEVNFDVMLCDGDGDAYKYSAIDVSKVDIVARDGDLDGKCT